jgi:hypothetical protein
MNLSPKEEACGSRRVAGCRGSCRVWLHDGSPARDAASRDVVGGASEPAPLTVVSISVTSTYRAISSYGKELMATRRAGFLPALKDRAPARDLW